MTDTITLRRDGIEATVRVGDRVPMMDGTERIIDNIPARECGLWLRRHRQRNAWWYEPDGVYADPDDRRPAIDIAKLAEQQAALARPAAVPAEAIREMEQRLRDLAHKHWHRDAAKRQSNDTRELVTALNEAADLLKLLEAHDG